METVLLAYIGLMAVLGLGFIAFGIIAIKEMNK